VCSGYICKFSDLQIQSVLLDEIMKVIFFVLRLYNEHEVVLSL